MSQLRVVCVYVPANMQQNTFLKDSICDRDIDEYRNIAWIWTDHAFQKNDVYIQPVTTWGKMSIQYSPVHPLLRVPLDPKSIELFHNAHKLYL